jgi:uncharacterized delta-60 repeat protein
MDGTTDNSFSLTSQYTVRSIERQSDGKILIGRSYDVFGSPPPLVLRLNVDGTVDPGFSCGINIRDSRAYALATQADGKILVAGYFSNPNDTTDSLYRLNVDGSVDTSFPVRRAPIIQALLVQPTGNILIGGWLGTFERIDRSGNDDLTFPGFVGEFSFANSVDIAPNGKIYVGGDFTSVNGHQKQFFARLNRDGTVDFSFNCIGTNGPVLDVVVQSDGKVIVAGEFGLLSGAPRLNIGRVNPDGTIDTTFDSELGADLAINDVALQPDGKIIIGGIFVNYGDIPRRFIARLNSDGSLDTTFNTGFPGPSNSINSIIPLADGNYIIAGYFNELNGAQVGKIARLNSNGTRDASFNAGGVGVAPFSLSSPITSVALQPDGKIIAGGVFESYNGTPRTGLFRVHPNGALDTSFTTTTQQVFALATYPDGRILVGGVFSNIGGVPRNSLARLLPDGSVDLGFGAGVGPDNGILGLDYLGESEIVLVGRFRNFNGQPHVGIAKMGAGASAIVGPLDFDGDGKTDIGIFRPTAGASEWWINRSSDGQTFALQFGSSTDKIVPADYTGDGKADVAIFRPVSGEWYVLRSEDFSFFALPFGTNGDVPVPADYDADGKADFAVFRPSSSTWFISQSSGAPTRIVQFGVMGDQPVVSDYDGDGKADIGIFRQVASGAEWWIDRSTAGLLAMQFGASTDKAVQGDYTGDGKADIAIWRPSTGEWFIVRSENFSFYAFPFGTNGDVVAPGDYDGDGKFDVTVFRPSSSTWFISRTTAGTQILPFGANGDRPIPNAFVP